MHWLEFFLSLSMVLFYHRSKSQCVYHHMIFLAQIYKCTGLQGFLGNRLAAVFTTANHYIMYRDLWVIFSYMTIRWFKDIDNFFNLQHIIFHRFFFPQCLPNSFVCQIPIHGSGLLYHIIATNWGWRLNCVSSSFQSLLLTCHRSV